MAVASSHAGRLHFIISSRLDVGSSQTNLSRISKFVAKDAIGDVQGTNKRRALPRVTVTNG